jgi:hypothetical protein
VIADDTMLVVLRACTGLESLTLRMCPLLSDIFLASMSTTPPPLHRLVLHGMSLISGEGVAEIVHASPQLTVLHVTDCVMVRNHAGVPVVVAVLTRSQVGNSAALAAARSPHLTDIDFSGCPRIGPVAAVALALYRPQRLHRVALAGTSVTATAARALMLTASNLTHLDLRDYCGTDLRGAALRGPRCNVLTTATSGSNASIDQLVETEVMASPGALGSGRSYSSGVSSVSFE